MNRVGDRIRRVLAPVFLIVALGAVGSAEQAQSTYLYTLTTPARGDGIGYANAVTADLVTGEIFVCDSRRSRILIFDTEGHFRYQIRGGTVFSGPRDLAVDPDGYLFVLATYQGRRALIQLDFDGLFMREIVLSGMPFTEGVRSNLSSVAISPSGDRLYLVDSNRLELWIADREGNVDRVIRLATEALEEAQLGLVVGRVDVYGERMLVGLPTDARVRIYDLDGNFVTSVGDRGSAPCHLTAPVAGALDAGDNVIVVDSQRMSVVGWEATTNRCVGDHFRPGGRPGDLYYPVDIALDPMGRLYVSQGYQGRVQVYEGFLPAAEPPPPPWELFDLESIEGSADATEDGPEETEGP